MKTKPMLVKIHRWNEKRNNFVTQEKKLRTVLDGISICSRVDHSMCAHNTETIVFRNQEITQISFFPTSYTVAIYTRERDGGE